MHILVVCRCLKTKERLDLSQFSPDGAKYEQQVVEYGVRRTRTVLASTPVCSAVPQPCRRYTQGLWLGFLRHMPPLGFCALDPIFTRPPHIL